MEKMTTFKEVSEIIRSANNISIYTHINTDCDAMGSAIALREALKLMGKNADADCGKIYFCVVLWLFNWFIHKKKAARPSSPLRGRTPWASPLSR